VKWSAVKEHEQDYLSQKKKSEAVHKDHSKENKQRLKTTQSSSSSSSSSSSQASYRPKKVHTSKSQYHESAFYRKLQEEERKK